MSNQNNRPLTFGVYETTPAFQAIPKHSCVCYADDRGLVAVTGPADDPESQRLSELFAAAPELLAACKLLIKQYDESGDFVMGGKLTNQPFLMAEAALKKAGQEGSHD